MVYAEDLKSLPRKRLWVRVPPPALMHPTSEPVSDVVDVFAEVGLESERHGTREYAGRREQGREEF